MKLASKLHEARMKSWPNQQILCKTRRPSVVRTRAGAHRSAMSQGDLSGRTYFVTGSTDGIGQHTALKLADAGADVIVHGRNPEKVAAACKRLSGKGGKITSYTCDLSSFAQIRKLTDKIKADFSSINVLINNAGVFEQRKMLSEDGFEMTWAINVLAPFLLTSLLKEIITERIVNVSSISASSRIDFDNLQQEKGFSSHDSYSLSKLASMMFTFDLAEIMKPKGVTVNCLDPGTVNTKMLIAGWGACGIDAKAVIGHVQDLYDDLQAFASKIGISKSILLPQDANNEYKLATDPSLAKETGKYFVGGRESRVPSAAQDLSTRRRLWSILAEQTGAA